MIRRDGRRMVVGGPVTLANIASVLEEGRRHLDEGVRVVDLSEVTQLDSSLLAGLLAWRRHARAKEAELAFASLPDGLRTIARLYGVDGLLPLTRPESRP